MIRIIDNSYLAAVLAAEPPHSKAEEMIKNKTPYDADWDLFNVTWFILLVAVTTILVNILCVAAGNEWFTTFWVVTGLWIGLTSYHLIVFAFAVNKQRVKMKSSTNTETPEAQTNNGVPARMSVPFLDLLRDRESRTTVTPVEKTNFNGRRSPQVSAHTGSGLNGQIINEEV